MLAVPARFYGLDVGAVASATWAGQRGHEDNRDCSRGGPGGSAIPCLRSWGGRLCYQEALALRLAWTARRLAGVIAP